MFKQSSTLLFPILLLALLAAVTYWVNIKVQPAPPRPDSALRHDPDYYLKDFLTAKTDLNGKLRYRLQAETMEHFPDNDSTELDKPIFTQYDAGKQYVRVTGLHGEVSSNGEDVKIYKNVLVKREPWGDKGVMTLETEYLHVMPEVDIALTQKPVLIKQAPKTVIRANGMVYQKSKKKLTLLNKVRAHYVRPKQKPSKPIETLADQKTTKSVKEIDKLRKQSLEKKNLPNENRTF